MNTTKTTEKVSSAILNHERKSSVFIGAGATTEKPNTLEKEKPFNTPLSSKQLTDFYLGKIELPEIGSVENLATALRQPSHNIKASVIHRLLPSQNVSDELRIAFRDNPDVISMYKHLAINVLATFGITVDWDLSVRATNPDTLLNNAWVSLRTVAEFKDAHLLQSVIKSLYLLSQKDLARNLLDFVLRTYNKPECAKKPTSSLLNLLSSLPPIKDPPKPEPIKVDLLKPVPPAPPKPEQIAAESPPSINLRDIPVPKSISELYSSGDYHVFHGEEKVCLIKKDYSVGYKVAAQEGGFAGGIVGVDLNLNHLYKNPYYYNGALANIPDCYLTDLIKIDMDMHTKWIFRYHDRVLVFKPMKEFLPLDKDEIVPQEAINELHKVNMIYRKADPSNFMKTSMNGKMIYFPINGKYLSYNKPKSKTKESPLKPVPTAPPKPEPIAAEPPLPINLRDIPVPKRISELYLSGDFKIYHGGVRVCLIKKDYSVGYKVALERGGFAGNAGADLNLNHLYKNPNYYNGALANVPDCYLTDPILIDMDMHTKWIIRYHDRVLVFKPMKEFLPLDKDEIVPQEAIDELHKVGMSHIEANSSNFMKTSMDGKMIYFPIDGKYLSKIKPKPKTEESPMEESTNFLSEKLAKIKFKSPQTDNSKITRTVFKEITDIRKQENVDLCEKRMNLRLNKHMDKAYSSVFAWDSKHKYEPKSKLNEEHNYFNFDFGDSEISFRAMDKESDEKWSVSDLLELMITKYPELNKPYHACQILHIGDKDKTIIEKMKTVFESKNDDQTKITEIENYFLKHDPVGKSVSRSLARLGYKIKLGSLHWTVCLDNIPYTQEILSIYLTKRLTCLRFEIEKM